MLTFDADSHSPSLQDGAQSICTEMSPAIAPWSTVWGFSVHGGLGTRYRLFSTYATSFASASLVLTMRKNRKMALGQSCRNSRISEKRRCQ
jgi:hypothetical protein